MDHLFNLWYVQYKKIILRGIYIQFHGHIEQMDRLQVDFVYNNNFALSLQDGAKFIRMAFMTDTWTERSMIYFIQ